MNRTARKIEIFCAGCPACEPVVELVKSIACPSCDVHVLDMNEPEVAAKAQQYGLKAVPPWLLTVSLPAAATVPVRLSRRCAPQA